MLARYHVSRSHTGHEHRAAQHELNVWHADALTMADRHIVYKQCLKEVGQQVRVGRGAASTESMAGLRAVTHACIFTQLGVTVTFMAKPFHDTTGSGCHLHIKWGPCRRAAHAGLALQLD